jgi:hypothetical protein
MVASIALGCGGKECFAGHERERSRHRFVPVAAFLSSRRGQATDSGRHHVIARQAFPARERPPAVGLGAVGLGAAVPPECDRRPRQANAVLQTVPDKFGLPLRFAALPLRFAARNGAQRKLGRSPRPIAEGPPSFDGPRRLSAHHATRQRQLRAIAASAFFVLDCHAATRRRIALSRACAVLANFPFLAVSFVQGQHAATPAHHQAKVHRIGADCSFDAIHGAIHGLSVARRLSLHQRNVTTRRAANGPIWTIWI